MIVGTAAKRPEELAVGFLDREIVDGGVAMMHDAVLIELPVLVSVGAVPVAGVIVTLVGEANGDACAVEGPQLFDEAIVEFALPLSCEEGDDVRASVDELGAISPLAVYRVAKRDLFRIACVPIVFRLSYLCCRGLAGKWRD